MSRGSARLHVRLTKSRIKCHYGFARTHPGVLVMRTHRVFLLYLVIGAALFSSCGGGGSSPPPPPPQVPAVSLSPTSLTFSAQTEGTTSAAQSVTLTNTGNASLSITTISATGDFAEKDTCGATVLAGANCTINVTFTPVVSGSRTGSVTITDNAAGSPQTISATGTGQILATVQNTVDTSAGVNGQLQQFMATSFQPAEWDDQFFISHPDVTPLTNLGPQHIRIQGVSQAVPMKANSSPPQSTDWDFTILDEVVQPILSAADHSPEFQIAVAPNFMNYQSGAQAGQFDITDHLNDFVQYSANLVSYYNKGGFDWGGKHFQSPSTGTYRITWWGIFNEYNINGLTAAQYVQLYNAVVPAMLAADPTIKFSALELADFDYQTGDPRNNLPTFVAPANQGGVNAQMNIVSAHFYASCNQKDTDTQLFNAVAYFTSDVSYIYQQLKTRADLASVPVWVTENNVNADYDKGGGISACNGTPFVTDQRGTSAYFAAWRPYVFSQFGKVGNQALYHWDYDADPQYGEVDYTTGNKYLSYWVDYYLDYYFPSPPGASILNVMDTEPATAQTVEVLATRNPDNSVVVMLADHAVHASTDDNGPGDPRTAVVDISALGTFNSATQLTIDATFNGNTVPASIPVIPPGPRITVTLIGYGVTFLSLKP